MVIYKNSTIKNEIRNYHYLIKISNMLISLKNSLAIIAT